MKKTAITDRTIVEQGWKALLKTLGPAGATKFLLAVKHGHGNLARDLKDFRRGKTVEDAARLLRRLSPA